LSLNFRLKNLHLKYSPIASSLQGLQLLIAIGIIVIKAAAAVVVKKTAVKKVEYYYYNN